MPAFSNFITVVPVSTQFDFDEVLWAVGALNKQIIRDFSPLWEVSAAVDVARSLERVTPGKWKIALVDDIAEGGLKAFHSWVGNVPFALVEYSKTWTIQLSHECLEMLADPFGKHRIPGPSLASDQGRVEYLAEVCDPSQSDEFSYEVDGVRVSDFYTKNYFDPVYSPGVRYSFNQEKVSIPRPRNVPKGGYLTWRNPPDDTWWQYDNMGAQPQLVQIAEPKGAGARMAVDELTRERDRAFWSKRHKKLPMNFSLFDYSFFDGNDERARKLREAISRRKKKG